MESAHIYSPTLHGRHWLFLFLPLCFPHLQPVNPYKGTSAGPVNHAEVLEMNKSSRDKDSTYLLSACRICCEMESGESLPKKKQMQRSGKWIWCESALMYIDCRFPPELIAPVLGNLIHCVSVSELVSLSLASSAYLSRPQPTEGGKWWTAEEDNWQQGPATSSKLSGGALKFIRAHHVWIPALWGQCLAQRKGILQTVSDTWAATCDTSDDLLVL